MGGYSVTGGMPANAIAAFEQAARGGAFVGAYVCGSDVVVCSLECPASGTDWHGCRIIGRDGDSVGTFAAALLDLELGDFVRDSWQTAHPGRELPAGYEPKTRAVYPGLMARPEGV